MEHFWHFLKILKLGHFTENPQIRGLILQEKSVQNSCQQMQTVLDLSLRAMSMIGLNLKGITNYGNTLLKRNKGIPERQNFYIKLPMVLGRTFLVSNFF